MIGLRLALAVNLRCACAGPLNVYLNGLGTVNHVLNGDGERTGGDAEGQAYIC